MSQSNFTKPRTNGVAQRFNLLTPGTNRRGAGSPARRRFRPAFEVLEDRTLLAAYFAFSEYATGLPAGAASTFSITAKNADGSTDASYAGTVHFTSSDAQADLPADCTLTAGSATRGFSLKTPGTQSVTATDTVLSSLAGSLSTVVGSQAGRTVFAQPPAAVGNLIASAWAAPGGKIVGRFTYDAFSLSSGQTLTEIDWRGGYRDGGPPGRVLDFSVTIFESISGGSQPRVTNPLLPETPLAHYAAGGDAGETLVGTFDGQTMYDYRFALPTPFAAAEHVRYWVRIEAVQSDSPTWGIAAGSGGDGRHFRFRTDVPQFNFGSQDTAFAWMAANDSWHNGVTPCDVNGRDGVTPLDALILINYLNAQPGASLPPLPAAAPPYYDVNDDQSCTPLDVLQVVNYINSRPAESSGGEGEAVADPSASAETSAALAEPVAHGVARAAEGEAGPVVTVPSATLTGLSNPWALAFDSGGNLYVANFAGNSVSRFAPGATAPAATLMGIEHPRALAFDAGGNLYVASATADGTVRKFAPGSTTSTATLTGVRFPNALAFDAEGNLYVANNTEVGTVSKFAPGSTTPTDTLTGLQEPVALAFDASGDLYVASFKGNTVCRFAPGSTTPSDSVLSVNNPTALAFDAAGNLYATSLLGGTVSRFAPGSTTPDATLTGLTGPSALALDADGNLYVANYGGDTVSRFAPGSTTPTATLTGLTGPTALAFDARGNLYVANYQSTTISAFYSSANPWHNSSLVMDTNGDQQVTPLDALLIVNYLNASGPGAVPSVPLSPPRYLDVDGNWAVTALDALMVINYFNSQLEGAGEGEAMSLSLASSPVGSPGVQFVAAGNQGADAGDVDTAPGAAAWPADDVEAILADIAPDVLQGWEQVPLGV
jgi:sugar lactone lactonase YvrE